MGAELKSDGYDTDKNESYLAAYESHFRDLANKEIALLELGIFHGGSLLMWRDYFKKGAVVGLDMDRVELDDPSGRIHIYQGLQQDKQLLDKIRRETAPGGFDIIIDDASHLGELSKTSFWHLFENHLKPGGTYVVEDWRTGYWGKWPDGKSYDFGAPGLMTRLSGKNRLRSHDYGMVGFVKQLVDELGMDMITDPARGSTVPHRPTKFARMEINQGQVFILKAADGQSAGK